MRRESRPAFPLRLPGSEAVKIAEHNESDAPRERDQQRDEMHDECVTVADETVGEEAEAGRTERGNRMEHSQIGGTRERKPGNEDRRIDDRPQRLKDCGEDEDRPRELLQRSQRRPGERFAHLQPGPQREPRAEQVGEVGDEQHVAQPADLEH